LSTFRLSGEHPPVPQVPLFSLARPQDRLLALTGLGGLGLLGFFLAVGGTISLPVGGGVSLLWPAVALQFALSLWFGWPGVLVAVLFPFFSNLLVADGLTALAFTPANLVQGALPLLLFRFAGGSCFLRRPKDLLLLGSSAVLASTLAAWVGVSLHQLLAPSQSFWPLVRAWISSNAFCAFFLSWPLLRWLSPVLWEVGQTQRLGQGLAFGFHLVGAVFTLAGGAVATVITLHGLKTLGLPLEESSFPGILGFLLLPAVALGVHILWRLLAQPLDQLLADTEQATSGSFPPVGSAPEPAEFSLLRHRFAQTVASLAEQERRFRDLFAAVGEPILLVDPQGRLVDANPAFARVFQVPLERAKGRNLLAFNDLQARQQLKALLTRPPSPGPVSLRARARIGGKGFRQVHITVSPWYDPQGKFAGFCVITTDITLQEEAEKRQELAARLASLQHLLAGLAHEGNNLLQAALSLAERAILKDSSLKEKLGSLEDLRERAQTLVRRLALLAGEYRHVPQETFSAGELLVGVAAASTSQPEKKVRFAPPASYPLLRGQRSLLRHAVEALVRNALEASPAEGEVTVRFYEKTVGEGAEVAPGRYWVVEVADQGHGIRREDLPHVFDPFFTTRDRATHQGVGLTLARGAALHAGGTLTLESAPHQGTVARLWLPIEEESPQASSSPASSVRVLVVDDDPQVREGLVGVLQSLGMEVEAAASGQEALELLARQRPVDLVLLDLLMPGLSGFEVLAQLRQKNPRLPVLLSSGYAPDGRVQEALQQPFTWYLQKPYTLAQLQEALQQALGERPQKP